LLQHNISWRKFFLEEEGGAADGMKHIRQAGRRASERIIGNIDVRAARRARALGALAHGCAACVFLSPCARRQRVTRTARRL